MKMRISEPTWGLVMVCMACALGAASPLVRADTVSATFADQGGTPGQPYMEIVSLTSPELGGYSGWNFYAGLYNFQITAGSPDVTTAEADLGLTNGNSVFQAACIDFTHEVDFGESATWTLNNSLTAVTAPDNGVGISQPQANAIAYLWNNYYPGQLANNPSNPLTTMNAENAAIFQVAVWALVYGDEYNAGATNTSAASIFGPGSMTSGDISAALKYASDSWTDGGAITDTGVGALIADVADGSPNTQDFSSIVLVQTTATPGTAVPVPLPSAAGVGFSVLGGFGALAVLRNRLSRRIRIA